MNWIEVQAGRAQELEAAPSALPADGYVWLDLLHEDAAADPEFLPGTVERLAGVRLFDLHLQDAMNAQHPSFFDSTNDYQMLVFRKLSTGEVPPLEEKRATAADQRRLLQEIVTRPITFFLLDRMLVTVRQGPSRSIDAAIAGGRLSVGLSAVTHNGLAERGRSVAPDPSGYAAERFRQAPSVHGDRPSGPVSAPGADADGLTRWIDIALR